MITEAVISEESNPDNLTYYFAGLPNLTTCRVLSDGVNKKTPTNMSGMFI
ncbi:MAG: hypothetical protein MJ246_02000 [Clostridia bacterium]|nr:hypothetical protein [Clostridia bacterium]